MTALVDTEFTSGTTITSDWLNGVNDTLVELESSAGANLVGYLPAGTGAVSTTVQTKLRETVSVKDFGAVGDGIADDTVAINRAAKYVAGLGGGTVYYPAGVYRITRAIRIDDYDIETFQYSGNTRRNMVHQGAGRDATRIVADGFWTSIFTSFPEPFLPSDAAQPATKSANDPSAVPADEFVFLADGVVIDGFTLDCAYDTNVDGGAAYGSHYGTWGGVWPNGSTGPSTHAADNYQYPIYLYATTKVQITNCRIKKSWFNGVEIYRCHDLLIADNLIENCGDKANYLGYYSGIELDNATWKVIINNNSIRSCGTGIMSNGDTLPYVWRAVSDIVVTNNIFCDISFTGMYIFDWIQDWNISNNIFRNIGGSGISVALNAAVVAGREPQYIKIANNIIREFNLNNSVGAVGIRVTGGGTSVTGNEIFQESTGVTAQLWGIVAAGPSGSVPSGSAKGTLVSGNYLCGLWPAPDQNGGGGILAGSDNCQITGNTVISTGSVAYTAVLIAAADVKITGNDIRGSWLGGGGSRPIAFLSGVRPYIDDANFKPRLQIKTGSGRSGVSGWSAVNFTDYSPTQLIDDCDLFSPTLNKAVIPYSGIYRILLRARFNGVGTPTVPVACGMLAEVNGSLTYAVSFNLSAGFFDMSSEELVSLNSGDSVEMRTYGDGTYTVEPFTMMAIEFVRAQVQ